MDAFEKRLDGFLREYREIAHKYQIIILSGEEICPTDFARIFRRDSEEEITGQLDNHFEDARDKALTAEEFYRGGDGEWAQTTT